MIGNRYEIHTDLIRRLVRIEAFDAQGKCLASRTAHSKAEIGTILHDFDGLMHLGVDQIRLVQESYDVW